MTLFNIQHRFKTGFFISSLIFWGLFGWLGSWLGGLTVGQAAIAGFIAMFLHWESEWMHQMGHAWVAKKVGYPMKYIVFNWFLVGGFYPRDEQKLPAETHIRRALGGPPVSFFLGFLGWLVWTSFDFTCMARFLVGFYMWENLLVFGVGAFLPLGFTDGSTLLKWMPLRGTGVVG